MSAAKARRTPTGAGTAVEQEEATRLHVEQRRAFQAHAGVFAVGMIVMFGVNLLTNLSARLAGDWSAWWSAWALIGWGAGLAIHGVVVRLARPAHVAVVGDAS